MRGIFCLADFHLQSGDVTFVCGNEIARQQTLGYIIPLPSLFSLPLSVAFSHIVHQPLRQTKKKKKACLPGSISHIQGLMEQGGMRGDKRRSRVRTVAR